MKNNIGETLEALTASCKSFFLLERNVIAASLAIALVAYGFELFSFNLTIDDELWATRSYSTGWLYEGRWLQFFLSKVLFPVPVIPVVPFAVALVCTVVATIAIFRTLGVRHSGKLLLLSSTVVAFPSLLYTFSFDGLKFGIGIGYLLLAIALTFFVRNQIKSYLLSALFIGLAIAIYQTMVVAAVVLLLIWTTINTMDGRLNSKQAINAMSSIVLVVVGALLVYFLGRGIVSWLYGIPLGASGYQNNFFSVEELASHPVLALVRTIDAIKIGFGLTGDLHLGVKVGQRLFVLGAGVLILLGIFKSKHRYLLMLMFALWVFVFPYALTLANAGYPLPWRTHVEMPFVYAGLLLFVLNMAGKLPVPGFILAMCLGMWVNFQFYVIDNRMTGAAHLSLASDRVFASRLLDRIDQELAANPDARYLAVIGYHFNDYPTVLKPKFEGIGSSFFELEGGDPVRMLAFLNTLEQLKLSPAPPAKAVAVSEQFAAVDSAWPAPGSIWSYEDIIVVRFGEYTPEQINFLCANGSKISPCHR